MSSVSDSTHEFQLNNCPTDCISSVRFGPVSSQFLLVSSWDKTVRLYDLTSNVLRHKYTHQNAVLDCCFQDAVHSWSGGLDTQLKSFDFNSSSETVIGKHDAPIRCVEYCPEENFVITGSWDSTIRIWDPRKRNSAGVFRQPEKVYTITVCGEKLIVGTAKRLVLVWDLRNMGYVQQKRESSLKYQTRCIKAFPDKSGYVLSSIEGRVAVEYLDPSFEVQRKKYAFKCHRMRDSDGTELIYPVNTVSFHNAHNTFATGGSDGIVNIWDGINKKRLCQFHRYPTSVSSVAFSSDGTMLAIGSSYLYEQDEIKDIPPDTVFVRRVTEQETKPNYKKDL